MFFINIYHIRCLKTKTKINAGTEDMEYRVRPLVFIRN